MENNNNPKHILIDGEYFLRLRGDQPVPNKPGFTSEDIYVKILPDGFIDRTYMYNMPSFGFTPEPPNHMVRVPWDSPAEVDSPDLTGDEITLPEEPVIWPVIFDYQYQNPKPEPQPPADGQA